MTGWGYHWGGHRCVRGRTPVYGQPLTYPGQHHSDTAYGRPFTGVDGGYPAGGRRERAAGAARGAAVIREEPGGAAGLAPAPGQPGIGSIKLLLVPPSVPSPPRERGQRPSPLHFCDQPTDTLQVHRIIVLQRVELARQLQGGRIIVLHVLVIFCQMLEGWHALTLGELVPDRHRRFPETAAFVQCSQIEQASDVELPLMRLQMGQRS